MRPFGKRTHSKQLYLIKLLAGLAQGACIVFQSPKLLAKPPQTNSPQKHKGENHRCFFSQLSSSFCRLLAFLGTVVQGVALTIP